jgi:hypothetical protein
MAAEHLIAGDRGPEGARAAGPRHVPPQDPRPGGSSGGRAIRIARRAREASLPTCGCNPIPRCRHHHHQKQAPGWRLEQHQPGYHTWTTPSGRQYTTGPITYPT